MNMGNPCNQLRKAKLVKALIRRGVGGAVVGMEGVGLTHDDLVAKAITVLQTLLPEMWRRHRNR